MWTFMGAAVCIIVIAVGLVILSAYARNMSR